MIIFYNFSLTIFFRINDPVSLVSFHMYYIYLIYFSFITIFLSPKYPPKWRFKLKESSFYDQNH